MSETREDDIKTSQNLYAIQNGNGKIALSLFRIRGEAALFALTLRDPIWEDAHGTPAKWNVIKVVLRKEDWREAEDQIESEEQ